LQALAKEYVPEQVNIAYGAKLIFWTIILYPPFDPRLISVVAPAVAKAAMESGVLNPIMDWEI
jgi:malate dehydrogenase (oxaloacetate-decarboxylating)(NADP+)